MYQLAIEASRKGKDDLLCRYREEQALNAFSECEVYFAASSMEKLTLQRAYCRYVSLSTAHQFQVRQRRKSAAPWEHMNNFFD